DTYSVRAGLMLNVALPGALPIDTDADGDFLSASVVTTTTHGSLSLSSSGSFTYTPSMGYVGDDSFTYHDFDGTTFGNTATVTIHVTNTPPVASNHTPSAHAGLSL